MSGNKNSGRKADTTDRICSNPNCGLYVPYENTFYIKRKLCAPCMKYEQTHDGAKRPRWLVKRANPDVLLPVKCACGEWAVHLRTPVKVGSVTEVYDLCAACMADQLVLDAEDWTLSPDPGPLPFVKVGAWRI